MDLKEYGRLVRRNWMVIVACALLGTLAAAAASFLIRPVYTSHTQLFVSIQSTGTVAELQQGNTFTQARVQTYVETAKTPAVLQPVVDSLGLDVSPAKLAETVSASADLNTVLITISAVDSSPVQAAAVAQAVADSLVETVGQLETPSMGGVSPIKLSVVTPAVAPTAPSAPDTKLNLFVGLVVGLMAGVGTAILRSALDTKVRGEADVSRVTKAPILGGISFDVDAAKRPVLTQAAPQSPRAESFRQIRTNLQFANVDSNSNTILVTSSLPGEGKSTTATNMAIAMAQAGQRVVLIDADLRRPMVATYLGLESGAGLTTALIGTADVEDLLQPWGEDDLYVLTSGQIPPNPSELLGSEAMSKMITRLSDEFDAVIVDAPPLIPVTDSTVLAQKVSGVVLVVASGKIQSRDLEKSLSSLELVKANLLGTVLNMLPSKGPDAYAYSYYSYESKGESAGGKRSNKRTAKSVNGGHFVTGNRGRHEVSESADIVR
ncbi:polysaccharide biosynthesis tyrosine autokinase [Arthrobacter zhaoxinii]|uniref:polysaccharide biosynthesis tyrosine autokinase n=1 Tax=Arthrobacter zhaoxinii TaxID=2964616 RepID=UPI002107B957|nr:polysaccharide biosynthesis tyrosine autokinase [Arthrobacter zhaoxinii]MCQ2001773.1 polysaccharide biosynthesis tyrosine autokinase [Arthrobacter zhaoxinii]